jgi:uncharacterized membrane protein YcjF (UPF0283 family)
LKNKASIAAAGRARIEEQKQTALTKIQKNREAALKQLDIQYANWDKAKTSFGFIGITFLAVLFGSIFGNDLIKLIVHYFNHLRDWYRRWCQSQRPEEKSEEENEREIILEMDQSYADDLEDSLENPRDKSC